MKPQLVRSTTGSSDPPYFIIATTITMMTGPTGAAAGRRSLLTLAALVMTTLFLLSVTTTTIAFTPSYNYRRRPLRQRSSSLASSPSTTSSTSSDNVALQEAYPKTMSEPPCYWKPSWEKGKRQWHRRIHLQDVKVGQKLKGTVVQELLDGKTGPKLFCEVGVGRTNSKGEWNIVNAMLRLDRGKKSVIQKRATRLRQKEAVDLWVSRVQAECGRLEVCLEKEEIQQYTAAEPKIPVTSLEAGMEVRGRIVRILPYGVMVDVGANRLGLLHILKVRELYDKFIDREQGLVEAGLERGAKVRLCVKSVDKRRLELDFTDDVKEDAKAELQLEAGNSSPPTKEDSLADSDDSAQDTSMSAEELAEWAALAQGGDDQWVAPSQEVLTDSDGVEAEYEEEEDDDEEYDDYDEQRDIEDSLGLGYY